MVLFWYDIRQMDDRSYAAALALMDAERRRRIDSFPAADDRRRSAAGERLVRDAAAARMGVAPQSVPLQWDDAGKPSVPDASFFVSVSHSGPFVVCAVGGRPLGLDIEVIRGAEEKFMRRACTEAEMSYIRYGDADCFARFWECWTAKEALFKLTGHGPLLSLSRLALPEDTALDHTVQNGCAVTVATRL